MRAARAARSVESMRAQGPNAQTGRVVIAGGGVAGLELLLGLGAMAQQRARIELVSPQRDFVYRASSVAEPFGLGRAHRFDLAGLVEDRGARFVPEAIASVDPDSRFVRTRRGTEIAYDSLVLAWGAIAQPAVPGALTFWGSPGSAEFRGLLRDLESGGPRDIVFVVPPGPGWPLPLYELALLTRRHLGARGVSGVGVTVATHEGAPLELFGRRASGIVAELLAERGIAVCTGCYPVGTSDAGLEVVPDGRLPADRVVSMPRLTGRPIAGIPHDAEGFVPVDAHGRVEGLDDVYAAGDLTNLPVKQGGIAAQQADAVAESLAAELGAPVDPEPFRPVLRGLLLTGREPEFLRAEVGGGRGEASTPSTDALWWPPGKVVGRFLAPHLAALAHAEPTPQPPVDAGALAVDIPLEERSVVH
jgi:sulfide:quinone oxidoreductase